MRLERSIAIARSIEVVFAYVTTMDNVKSWLPVKDIRAISEGPMRVGSTYAQTAVFMGRQFDSTIEITRYEPPRLFAFKMIQGPFPLANTMTFASTPDGGTMLTVIGEAEPGNTLNFVGPLVTPIVKKQLENQVTALKKAIEAIPAG
ncbi:ATPase [Dictyobacter sp. S3.2.2.5]|uniref:ATPase n=1 Tax=Dictyobacter halimunensis TaxID=3026934 RepID=A0ABQ6FXS2_9CHLR|nr:ATPase [Dictyobacter sp. S3.2.2.5]